MVRLYGVIPFISVTEMNFISIRERIKGLTPNPELLKDIQEMHIKMQ